jgi:hypothetical protein
MLANGVGTTSMPMPRSRTDLKVLKLGETQIPGTNSFTISTSRPAMAWRLFPTVGLIPKEHNDDQSTPNYSGS